MKEEEDDDESEKEVEWFYNLESRSKDRYRSSSCWMAWWV
jgi:hypothetical protein